MPKESINDFVSSLYKPFRNQIRQYNLLDSLYLIWAYARNFAFDLPVPNDIELQGGFIRSADINSRRYHGILEFEQEYLMKEFILHCHDLPTSETLRHRKNQAKLINYLRKSFGNEIDKKFRNPGDDIFLEFNRMAHKQFIWQPGYNQNDIFRYYKVYGDPVIDSLIKRKLQLSTFELYILGFFFVRWTSIHYRTKLPITLDFPIITNEMIEIFLKNFSITIEQAKHELSNSQQINENIFYTYNPLKATPILIYEETCVCPIPLYLYWQFTNGIYYLIVKEEGFDNAFGNSFQNYIGEVIYKCCTQAIFHIFPEEKYGRQNKRTADWIIIDNNAIMFIECKTKRMIMPSKTEIDIKKGLEGDLKKMASFVVQLYKTYIDYSHEKYHHISFDPDKKFVPLVVTLENWYVHLNHLIEGILKDFVIEAFHESNIDTKLLEKFPYHIRSSSELENDIQLINSLGITGYFEKIISPDFHEFETKFNYTDPFEGEFEKTFIEPLRMHL